jgi:hypothetical protein
MCNPASDKKYAQTGDGRTPDEKRSTAANLLDATSRRDAHGDIAEHLALKDAPIGNGFESGQRF